MFCTLKDINHLNSSYISLLREQLPPVTHVLSYLLEAAIAGVGLRVDQRCCSIFMPLSFSGVYFFCYFPFPPNGLLKRVLHILPKSSMFCALSQNNEHLLEKITYESYSKLCKELKNGTEILVG